MCSFHTWQEWSSFVVGFFRNPGQNGSIIPSSRSLSDAMLSALPWDRIRTLVELGPGVGTFTVGIMERAHLDTRIILVEIDHTYAEHLREKYKSRAIVEEVSAADLDTILARYSIDCPDCIISGLPLTSLPVPISRRIVDHIRRYIERGAVYRAFTYRPSRTMGFFGKGVLERKSPRIWDNFPPAVVVGKN